MKHMIISENTEDRINNRLDELMKDHFVDILFLSTCPAPEKHSRYDTAITVVVGLTGKVETSLKDDDDWEVELKK